MDLGKNSTVWQRQEQNSKTSWRHQEWILRWIQSVTEPWVFQMKIFMKRQPWKKPATNRLAKQSWSWRITVEKATSNGNCLYNSASIILNGNEDLSLLLRLLTAVELYKNAPFYAIHPNLPEAASDCCLPEISLFIQFLSDWGLKVIENTKDRNEAVKGEAIAGCRDKKLSEMIHMMALSTVIGRLIFPLYPECNKNTRPLCRKDILPRDYGTK